MKRNSHESLNNWEINHKDSLLGDTPGVYVQKYSDYWVLYVSWQSLQVKFQMASLLCLADFSTVNVNSTSTRLLTARLSFKAGGESPDIHTGSLCP